MQFNILLLITLVFGVSARVIVEQKQNPLQLEMEFKLNLDNLTKIMEENIKTSTSNFSKLIEVMKEDLLKRMDDSTNAIINKFNLKFTNDVANEIISKPMESKLQEPINKLSSIVYDEKLTFASEILKQLNLIPDGYQQILEYRNLFDGLKNNGYEYSFVTSIIAYRAAVDFWPNHPNNNDLIYLLDHLPETLIMLPWDEGFNMTNVKYSERLFTYRTNIKFNGLTPYPYDDNRRYALTNDKTFCDNHQASCEWNIDINRDKTSFNIRRSNSEFLYAESNELNLDDTHRRVFTWNVTESQNYEPQDWNLELIKGTQYFKIKNVKYDEYLCIAEGTTEPIFNKYLQVFTTKDVTKDGCQWRIKRGY